MDDYDFELIVINPQAIDFGDSIVACVKGIKFAGILDVPKANMQAVGYCLFDIDNDAEDGKQYPIGVIELDNNYVMYFDPLAKKTKKNFNVMASMVAYHFQMKDKKTQFFADKMMIFSKAVVARKGDSAYNPNSIDCEKFMRELGKAFTEVDKEGNPVNDGFSINKLDPNKFKNLYNTNFSDN